MGSSVSAKDRIQPRMLTTAWPAGLMVSIRLRMPRRVSRWFIGTLAWPSGRASSARYSRYPGRTQSRQRGTMSRVNRVVCS